MNIGKSEIMNHELSRLNINILFSFSTFFIFLYVLRAIALVTFRSYDVRGLVVEKCETKWLNSGKQFIFLWLKQFTRHESWRLK